MLILSLFLLLGVVLVVGGACIGISEHSYRARAEHTTATIKEIETYFIYDSDDTKYSVSIEYVVNGTLYSGKMRYYTSSMQEGGTVGIYYDPHNPQDFKVDSGLFLPLLFAGLGVVFSLVGCALRSGVHRKPF